MSDLADGQVSDVLAELYSVPLTKATASVANILFFNTSATTQIIVLFYQSRFGTARQIGRFELLENERGEYVEVGDTLEMGIGDAIQAQTTTASVVNFFIFGDES